MLLTIFTMFSLITRVSTITDIALKYYDKFQSFLTKIIKMVASKKLIRTKKNNFNKKFTLQVIPFHDNKITGIIIGNILLIVKLHYSFCSNVIFSAPVQDIYLKFLLKNPLTNEYLFYSYFVPLFVINRNIRICPCFSFVSTEMLLHLKDNDCLRVNTQNKLRIDKLQHIKGLYKEINKLQDQQQNCLNVKSRKEEY